MKPHLNLLLCFYVIMALSACGRNVADTAPISRSCLPGECLRHTELIFLQGYLDTYDGKDVVRLRFKLDMDCEWEELNGKMDGRLIPKKRIFQSFGQKAKMVEEEYHNYCDRLQFKRWGDVTTLYYQDGIALTIDNITALFPADMGSLVFFPKDTTPVLESELPGVENTGGMRRLYHTFSILIPFDFSGANLDESIHFNLTMPVKVGKLLHYLEERIGLPEAKMEFQDEVLTCKFKVNLAY